VYIVPKTRVAVDRYGMEEPDAFFEASTHDHASRSLVDVTNATKVGYPSKFHSLHKKLALQSDQRRSLVFQGENPSFDNNVYSRSVLKVYSRLNDKETADQVPGIDLSSVSTEPESVMQTEENEVGEEDLPCTEEIGDVDEPGKENESRRKYYEKAFDTCADESYMDFDTPGDLSSISEDRDVQTLETNLREKGSGSYQIQSQEKKNQNTITASSAVSVDIKVLNDRSQYSTWTDTATPLDQNVRKRLSSRFNEYEPSEVCDDKEDQSPTFNLSKSNTPVMSMDPHRSSSIVDNIPSASQYKSQRRKGSMKNGQELHGHVDSSPSNYRKQQKDNSQIKCSEKYSSESAHKRKKQKKPNNRFGTVFESFHKLVHSR
jgi:hypothetical protein